MRITQWGEYGIHCAVIIAQHEQLKNRPVGAEHISQTLNIDLQYAQQILQRLRRNNIIKSVRGPHGGYRLSQSPNSISLYEILKASEGDTFQIICETRPIKLERCRPDCSCYLKDTWHQLRQQINSFLQGYSLSELARSEAGQGKVVHLGHYY